MTYLLKGNFTTKILLKVNFTTLQNCFINIGDMTSDSLETPQYHFFNRKTIFNSC